MTVCSNCTTDMSNVYYTSLREGKLILWGKALPVFVQAFCTANKRYYTEIRYYTIRYYVVDRRKLTKIPDPVNVVTCEVREPKTEMM